MSQEQGCSMEIFLGDTFDRPDIDAESVTALSEIHWNKGITRHFIVGNHESGMASLRYNSTQILHKVGMIEDKPLLQPFDGTVDVLFLPYITEDERKPLSEYLANRKEGKRLLVCSHNDLKNFQMGAFLSKTGFDVDDIASNCDLYLNGHLHNCGWVGKKICNVGVLCGQNFSEDAFKYEHHVAILDTDTFEIRFFENPYAINFYKLEINSRNDFGKIDRIKENAVVSIKCPKEFKDELRQTLDADPRILTYKMTISVETAATNSCENKLELGGLDYLGKFREFILDNLGNNEVVQEELGEVCKQ